MGEPTGFVRWPRQQKGTRPIGERLTDYGEVGLLPTRDAITHQAGRCMDCGVPFCLAACPLGNRVPDFADLAYRARWREAWEVLSSTTGLPEICGRVCPAPCEQGCTLAIGLAPVSICQIELALAEHAFAEGWVAPRPPARRTGRHVGVVGSGPAGLAAASLLNRAGHLVTIYERSDRAGGLLRYGIPDFKLDKRVLDRRLAVLLAEGVRLRTSVEVGVDLDWGELRGHHDALLLALGATTPRDLSIPGRELSGIHLAMPFLEQQNRVVAGLPVDGRRLSAAGLRVVILGGGDTGADCHGTALRQGAAAVTSVELMPEPPASRPRGNPWPEWPRVLRVSSSHEEGGERLFGLRTTRFLGAEGRVTAIEATRVRGAGPGGPPGLEDIPGSATLIEADLVLIAAGFAGTASAGAVASLGVETDERGCFAIDDRHATSVPGVFAAGDATRGASLVVWALAEGRRAAAEILAFLG